MQHVDSGHHLEQLARNVRHRSDACRREVDLARISLGIRDEFGDRFGRKSGIDHHDLWHTIYACYRYNVAHQIEVDVLVERRIYGIIRADEKKRIAIRRRAHHGFRRYIAPRAWTVLYDKRLTQPVRKPLADQARENVDRLPRSKPDKEMYGPRGVRLSLCNSPERGKRAGASEQMQESPTRKSHGPSSPP